MFDPCLEDPCWGCEKSRKRTIGNDELQLQVFRNALGNSVLSLQLLTQKCPCRVTFVLDLGKSFAEG